MPYIQTNAGAGGATAEPAGGVPIPPIEEDALAPMAVVAMACRFPGEATSSANFWDMLCKGRSAWSEVPENRFNADAFWHPNNNRSGTMTTKAGHFLTDDPGVFDAPFFSMSAPEAIATDPQLRMMLEVAFESFESGGIPMEDLVGSKTSCFVGCSAADYNAVAGRDIDDIPLYQAIGGGNAMLSNRISHFFDLRGHSMTLDTACSSGLIALHLGCQSIRAGESKASVIAATQLMLIPDMMTSLANLHFLSPDGRCYTFDDRANGYSRGEGTCVMVIKSLADAIKDGDTIRAVIRGTGTNQDGKTPGIVQPSSEAQADLIRSTYKVAGLDYNKTMYFEAHGTGTPVGDPLELSAVGATLGTGQRPEGQPLYVGSVKTNIGHLEGCAGLAGLMKSILCLENGVIVPNINYENPNPRLRLDEWGLKVPTKAVPWPVRGLRRASINSFGYGGSNAHCILDDAYHYLKSHGLKGNTQTHPFSVITPASSDDEADSGRGTMTGSPVRANGDYFPPATGMRPRLFVWSSLEQQAVQNLIKSYSEFVTNKSVREPLDADNFLADLAYTLGNRRSVFPWRASFVASSKSELGSLLGEKVKGHRAGKSPSTAFIFTGQGAQWPAMGQELLAYDVFANSIREADKYLTSLGAEWSVMTELTAPEKDSQISLAKFSQPLCAALQVALVDLLAHWGVKPQAVIGHSSGEIGAAYTAGALSAEDCWKVAYHRGRLSHSIKDIAPQLNGSMMAVGLSEEEVKPYLEKLDSTDTAVVACVNSPSNVTISGDVASLDKLADLLKPANVFARTLKVENAYHSPHMQTIAEEYGAAIKDIKPLKPKSGPTMISSVTGNPVKASDLDAAYWVSNMVSPVQFVQAVGHVCAASPKGMRRRRKHGLAADTLLEVGPHSAMQGPLKQILAANGRAEDTTYLSMLSRGQDGVVTSLEASGKLWSMGQSLDLLRVNAYESDPTPLTALPDMPNYAWNHNHTFWHETSASLNHRFKKTPRLDILGKRVDDFNPLEPRWTNSIRKQEIPWVKDHMIQDAIVFPGAGMLSAVLEGLQQMADETKTVHSFEMRDINLSRAFIIPADDTKVVMGVHLKPRKLGLKGSEMPWYEFTVYATIGDEDTAEQCSGLGMIHYVKEEENLEETAESAAEWQAWKDDYAESQRACEKSVEPKDFYNKWYSRGMQYGPQFRPISKIAIGDGGVACCTIVVQDTKAKMPAEFEFDHLIHPVTLDGLTQTIFAAIMDIDSSIMPTGVNSIVVSARLPKGPGAEFQGVTHVTRRGLRESSCDIAMSDDFWSEPKVVIKGLTMTEVGGFVDDGSGSKPGSSVRKMCAEMIWKEDVDHVRQLEAEQLFKSKQETSAEQAAACDRAAAIYMERAVSALTPDGEAALAPHEAKYVKWMRSRLAEIPSGGRTADDDNVFLAGFANSSVEARLISAVGESLSGILDGSVASLPVMMKDNMLFDFHANDPTTTMATQWLDLQGHKRPDYKVLELGAGTGAMTLPALETFGGRHGATARMAEYVFSDSDTSFFETAQTLLKDWQSHVTYKKLDIDRSPKEQDFQEGSFDVIIAGNVLHGTRSLGGALQHCNKLLKPGGRLVITDYTKPTDRVGFVLGALPNWWQFEDGRDDSPVIDEVAWARHLEASGFTGLDIAIKDTSDADAHSSSMMVSRKRKDLAVPFKKLVIVEPSEKSEAVSALSANVADEISKLGIEVAHANLETAVAVDSATGKPFVHGAHVISLVEAEKPLLMDITESEFKCLQDLILKSSGGLWVSRAGRQVDPTGDPSFCAISGLLRVVRCEKPDIRMMELDFSTRMRIASPEAADLVGRVIKSYCNDDLLQLESEFSERDGRLLCPRLIDEKHKNHSLQTLGMRPTPEGQPFNQEGRPLKLDIGTPGMLDSLHFIDDDSFAGDLGENDVEIEVQANSVNFLDVMVSMGLIADTLIGLDAAGTIKRVGSKVSLVKPGDRVATFCLGAYRNVLRTQETLVQNIPENLTVEEGASIPCVYITAVQGLIEIGRLQAGESVLIHSATGGLGQAAIQIAKHIGAEIFATAGSVEKRQLLVEEHGISVDHVFNSRDMNFARGILRMTKGRGVDVVLNSLAGEALRKTWECTAMYGRFIEVGKKDILANSGLEMMPFLRNVTFGGVNIEHMARHNPKLLGQVFGKAMNLIREGAIGLIKPITVHKYSEIEQAFRTMQQARHVGKIVIKAESNDLVPVIPRNPHPLTFDDKATYVLVGGLGGIGRALAIFMAGKGVKNLAFISRSGDSKPEAKGALKEIRALGINAVAYACDVTNIGDLRTTYANLAAEMPRVKGVIQAAMVLNDYYFEEMTYKQWIGTTRPKIQGSWNLHEIMPKDLDFFVMLSSISGVSGNGAQSNYAAGNTYQDGLAHYRHSQGLTACALDLGAISGVGWMAENMQVAAEYRGDFERMSLQPRELYSLLESAMTGYSEGEHAFPVQMVTGMGSGGIGQQMEHLKTSQAFDDPKYTFLRRLDVKGVVQSAEDTLGDVKTALTAATSLAQAGELVEGALAMKLAKSLSMAVDDIDTHKAVYSYGIDSLVAIEVRNWIFKELKAQVSVFDILAKAPMTQLALKIAGKSGFVPADVANNKEGSSGAADEHEDGAQEDS